MSEIPIGAVYTAGTATFTLTERGWIWEHPDQPDVHALQPDVKVREYIANGRIWPKTDGPRVTSDRDELAALIDTIVTNDPTTPLLAADAILARWRLVPVDSRGPLWFCPDCQDFQPQHQHWPHGLDIP